MAEQQIDELEAETFQRAVDRMQQVLAVQGVLHVDLVVEAPEHLRRDDVTVACPSQLGDRAAHDPFGLAARVGLGVVEEVDAGVVSRGHALAREILAQLIAVSDPGAEGQLADLQS